MIWWTRTRRTLLSQILADSLQGGEEVSYREVGKAVLDEKEESIGHRIGGPLIAGKHGGDASRDAGHGFGSLGAFVEQVHGFGEADEIPADGLGGIVHARLNAPGGAVFRDAALPCPSSPPVLPSAGGAGRASAAGAGA